MIYTDVDKDLYVYKQCGISMNLSPSWTPIPRSDIIPWCYSLYQKEFDDNFNIASTVFDSIHQAVIQIIHNNWISFCEIEISLPMLDFEFCIDTGNAKAVCCRQLT